MLLPNRHGSTDSYRYGYNGMEKDDELKGEGNSYDYGARMYDPRVGRWFNTDNINKPWLSQYQFSSGNPINYVDGDGNDEIHFYYYLTDVLNAEGKITQELTMWVEIIEDDKEHTFFMHDPKENLTKKEPTQFYPFQENRLPNQSSFEASYAELPLAQDISFLYIFSSRIDDHAYFGTLLEAVPELYEHYKGKREDGARFYGAKARASTANLTRDLNTGVEVVYDIVDGAILLKAIGKFAYKELSKNTLKIADDAIPKWNGPVDYSAVLTDSKFVGPGKNFTATQKKKILEANRKANGGYLRSDLDGTILDAPVQSKKGVKANMNQAEVDHIRAKKPKEGPQGSNSYGNSQVLSKKQNIKKSNNRP